MEERSNTFEGWMKVNGIRKGGKGRRIGIGKINVKYEMRRSRDGTK